MRARIWMGLLTMAAVSGCVAEPQPYYGGAGYYHTPPAYVGVETYRGDYYPSYRNRYHSGDHDGEWHRDRKAAHRDSDHRSHRHRDHDQDNDHDRDDDHDHDHRRH